MQDQTLQLFDGLKALLLMDAKYSSRLNPATIESGKTNAERCSGINQNNSFTLSHEAFHANENTIVHEGRMGSCPEKSTGVRHAQNFLLNAVAISICMTALILSMEALPVIFKVIAFCGSLMVGFIIEIMLNGDEYE